MIKNIKLTRNRVIITKNNSCHNINVPSLILEVFIHYLYKNFAVLDDSAMPFYFLRSILFCMLMSLRRIWR